MKSSQLSNIRHAIWFTATMFLWMLCIFSLTGIKEAHAGNCVVMVDSVRMESASFSILLSPGAPPHERYAAEEFRDYFERLTGERLSIVALPERKTPHAVYIGKIDDARKETGAIDFNDLGEEGLLIRTSGGNLVLAGGKRGALYAVYTLLEDYLGCGWYMPAPLGEVIPETGSFNLSGIEDLQKPSFAARQMSSVGDDKFMIHNKCDPTVSGNRAGDDRGDPAVFGTWGHIFDRLVEPGIYYVEHPEYFSLVKGKRIWDRGQVCTSNPEVYRITTRSVREIMNENPENKIFSVCQDDGYGWCECAECSAQDTRERKISDRLIIFCNEVAARIKMSHPDKLIYTYAYTEMGGDPPLSVRPADNLIIQITHYSPCCHIHPIETCPDNARMKERLDGWNRLNARLYVYDYRVDYRNYLMPYPDWYAVARDIPHYHDVGVEGMFYQGGTEVSQHGMVHWLLAKLMWNHKANAEELYGKFFKQYFQGAAAPMQRYFRLLNDRVWRENLHMNLYSRPTPEVFPAEVLREAEECFEEALGLANTDMVKRRIERERVPLYWVHLKVSRGTFPPDSRQMIRWIDFPEWRTALADFIRIATREGMTHMCESPQSNPMYIQGFVEEIMGMTVHDREEYRYIKGAGVHEGNYCVYSRVHENAEDQAWTFDPVVLKGNTSYTYSAWIKFEPHGPGSLVRCLAIPGSCESKVTIDEKTEWKQVSVTFSTPNTPSVVARVQPGRLTGPGEMWIDDVRLVEESNPEENLLENGNFEISRGTQPQGWWAPRVVGTDWLSYPPVKEFLMDPVGFEMK